ncbi:MAG: phenylacetate--CoA ligase family protein [Bacteroidota bacterium]
MKFFDLSLKLNGFPIKRARAELQEIQSKNDRHFNEFITSKKREIVEFHLKNNPFYQSMVGDFRTFNWTDVPIMTKQDLQQPLEKLLTKGFSKKQVYVNKTSGSSGDPFIFAKDKFCHAMTWAIIQNRFSWYNLDFNSSKQARFYGIPLEKSGYYKERIKDYFGNRFRFSIFDLGDMALEKCLEVFKKTDFDYINGYTSSIVQFAKFLNRKSIVLKQVCPSLKVCIVTSEMLFEDDKRLMEIQFGVPVVNEYGASELDLIAFQNPNGEWQVNSETLYVEVVDKNGAILPHGEEGRLVITSLYNKAHPFIRYDIGDIGSLSPTGSIKKPILKKLTGRTNDVVHLPSGKKAAGLTFYYITKSVIENDGNVKEFVIEQYEKSLFKITYASAKPLSETKENTVKNALERYLETGLTVEFEQMDKLKRSKSGKLRQFTSHLQLQD